jgi:hypothetical protein
MTPDQPDASISGMSKTEFREVFQKRLKALRGEKSREAFARDLDIPAENYRKYETRSDFPIDKLARLAEVTGRSLEFLLSGSEATWRATFPLCRSDTHAIPEIDVRAGMGGGGEVAVQYVPDGNGGMTAADDVRAEWGLPENYLRSELRIAPAQARIVEVQGDSMEPTLRSGERVMVDLADTRPSPPGIFALWDGYGVVVKRIEHILNSDPPRLRISSDNAHHREYELTAEEVRIIGRIVWAARRL